MDSSPNYGNSLNSIIKNNDSKKVRISTKVNINNKSINEFVANLVNHIKLLHSCKIEIIYFHESLISHKENFVEYQKAAYKICKEFGINKLGLSIYNPTDINDSNIDFDLLDIIQCPINLLDKRNLVLFKKYPKLEIVARSIFMQGILTEDGISLLLNSINAEDRKNANRIIEIKNKFQTNIETISMTGILVSPSIKTLLLGVNNYKQLISNYNYYNKAQILANSRNMNSNEFSDLSTDGSIFTRWWSKLAPKAK